MENISTNNNPITSRRQELLAELALLDQQGVLVDSLIKSPALDSISSTLRLNQPIAYIDSRLEVVPGIIKTINRDSTYDLEVYIPTPTVALKWQSGNRAFDRVESTELKPQPRLKTRLSDPRWNYRKQQQALTKPQRGEGGIIQTEIDIYSPVSDFDGKPVLLQLPRFHDFHTSLVGTFFDPSIYIFNITCFRNAIEIDGQKFPPVNEKFPRNKPYYEDFHKAYNKYFKEFHQGRSRKGSKWDSVVINAGLKGDS